MMELREEGWEGSGVEKMGHLSERD